jgi:uncharacterized protein (DUF58 family)
MLQRYLDPAVLASISGLDLVAKTVVDGFIAGLHRSPDFGFSQEFAEYRMYVPGDDLRHVDWNVFARTEKAFLKRYRGETNTQVTIVLDASSGMAHGRKLRKFDYSRFLAASIAYLASQQRDAVGLLVFDSEVRAHVPASARQGQLQRVLHAINQAEPPERAVKDVSKPFLRIQEFLKRRGLYVVISDFYGDPASTISAVAPLRGQGSEVALFHIFDPDEWQPPIAGPSILIDMGSGEEMEVTPEYARLEYPAKRDAQIQALKDGAKAWNMDYTFLLTSKPLDAALREYLGVRKGRV